MKFIKKYILNHPSSKSWFLEGGSDWSNWSEMSSDSFLCKRKDWQGVKLSSVLITTEPVLWDKYSKRQCKNGKKTIGNSKIKKVMTRVVIDLLATWTLTETLNWHGIFHEKADRESAALRTDSEYYKRTQSVIRYCSKQMFEVQKKVEQYHQEWSSH